MRISIVILLSVLIFAIQCNKSQPLAVQASAAAPIVAKEASGYTLLKKYCYACHNPEASSHDVILAPPLAAVKFRYLRQYPDRSRFVHEMVQFVKAPKKENALMFGAVSKFGVMTTLSVPDSTLNILMEYIYDNDLEKPAWFDQHFAGQHN